ncbi:hypothetical protein [Lignipirellula cremea]|uniref:Uncharacterized protein n=1 Tax=Lignipirellula cremea TaxID=2528010 RepID=A0A518DRA6_9BACT|nr:hypothetical protein [Lignipirellula cremea]QDU94366.1 hypothetical protein Pla8534_21550 [Lignipirellula cremea]
MATFLFARISCLPSQAAIVPPAGYRRKLPVKRLSDEIPLDPSMNPCSPPKSSSDQHGSRVAGLGAKAAAMVLSLAFVAILLQGLSRAVPGLRHEEYAESPIGILIGNGIWLLITGAFIAYLWRQGDHFLYPETHGFLVQEQRAAISILDNHHLKPAAGEMPVDAMYASLSLRDLLRTCRAMYKQKNPDRHNKLLYAIQAHADMQNTPSGEPSAESQRKPG